jgi:hypothetical protein
MSPDVPRATDTTSQTRRVSDTDYEAWLTKDEAAMAIGGSTKMVERLAADGQIQQASCQRQGRGAFRTVYHPDDVARVAQARRQTPAPFVLPAGTPVGGNGNGHSAGTGQVTPGQALAITSPTAPDQVASILCSFVAALRGVSETSETRSAYVDKAEALAITGVSYGELRAAVQAGEVKQRGRRYRRRDLEAL